VTTSEAGIPLADRIGATRRIGAVADAANLACINSLAEIVARNNPWETSFIVPSPALSATKDK
jgi:hypothetical protein